MFVPTWCPAMHSPTWLPLFLLYNPLSYVVPCHTSPGLSLSITTSSAMRTIWDQSATWYVCPVSEIIPLTPFTDTYSDSTFLGWSQRAVHCDCYCGPSDFWSTNWDWTPCSKATIKLQLHFPHCIKCKSYSLHICWLWVALWAHHTCHVLIHGLVLTTLWFGLAFSVWIILCILTNICLGLEACNVYKAVSEPPDCCGNP